MSTIELLIFNHCLIINWDVAMQWGLVFLEWCLFKRKLIACCLERLATCRWSQPMSGVVHTGVEVHRMDSEMSGLVEWPWLQLMCCAICLSYSRNFRWWGEVQDKSEYWLVCCHWTLEIEFNKRLSSSIIRLANYNITTSLIYKQIV